MKEAVTKDIFEGHSTGREMFHPLGCRGNPELPWIFLKHFCLASLFFVEAHSLPLCSILLSLLTTTDLLAVIMW